MSTRDAALGQCPRCRSPISPRFELIEYETDGELARYATCPECDDVVRPE